MKEKYFLKPDEDPDDDVESSRMDVLIANAHGIFGASADRTVQEFSRFYAYGNGSKLALGAMWVAYADPDESAEDVVRLGAEAAAEFDARSGLPVISFALELATNVR